MDIDKAKKVFGAPTEENNKPNFLNKADELVYLRGRKSFDDVRQKIMHTDKRKFIWGTKYDEKKIDLDFNKDPLKQSFSFFTLGLFTFSIILMIAAIVYAYYSFTTGGYSVRQDRIILSLELPTFTAAGQDLTGQLIVGNENRTPFKDAYVILEIEGEEGVPNKILNRVQVGDVNIGDKIYKNISINLSGLEGEEKKVKAVLYYRISQSESTFQKTYVHSVLITKSPVVMSVTGPKDLSPFQDGEYLVTVRGIAKVIPALLLTLDTPKHMRILSANFPEVAKRVYNLGPINEGDERVFKFVGSFNDVPEMGDKFTIKIRTGLGEENEMKAYFAESTYGINLIPNPVSISMFGENNQSGQKLSFTGKQPKVNLVVTNNSGTRVKDVDMQIKFSGGLFESRGVKIGGAVYDSSNSTAIANGTNNEKLREIDPGEQIDFPINFFELTKTTSALGRNINIEVIFSSNTEDSKGKPIIQRVLTVMTPTEGSSANLTTYYFSGVFKNTGPMPPRVGQRTTYTINLFVDTNAGFTNGKFILPLAPNVQFVKALDNTVSYNKETNIVTWNVGTLNKATTTTFGIAKKETSIQVSILPTPEQIRTAPSLTTNARFEGNLNDKEKTNFTIISNNATIVIQNDPKYVNNMGYDGVVE